MFCQKVNVLKELSFYIQRELLAETRQLLERQKMTKKLQILHLEDNQLDAELVKEILSLEDITFTLTHVDTKENFIQKITENEYDVILADYSLPAFDGLSALKEIQERKITTPFILVSAVLGEELAIEALHKGATDYILKSRLERLVPAIKRALREIEERDKREFLEKEIFELEKAYQKIAERVRGFLKMNISTGKFTLVDKFIEELSGYSTKEWYNSPNFIEKIIHPDFKDYYMKNFSRMKDGFIPKMMEYKIIREDGDIRWWLQFTIGSYDINQKLVSVSIVIVDNTDSKESFIKYQNLFENALVGMYRTDIETGRILEANETMARIFGYDTIEEYKNTRAEDSYLNNKARKDFIDALEKNGYVSDYPLKLKKKNGEIVWCSFNAKIYPSEGFIEGVMIDISDEKKAQEDLAKREKELENIFEHTGTVTVLINEDMIIAKANHQVERILGISQEEIEGKKKWTDFIYKEDLPKLIEYNKKRMSDEEVLDTYEFRIVDINGKVKTCIISIAQMPNSKQLIASVLDITDKKRAEEALKRDRQASQMIAKATVNATNIKSLCESVLKGIIEILEFDSGSIRILNETKKELLLMAHFGLEKESTESLKYKSIEDANFELGKILGKPIFAPDVEKHEYLRKMKFHETHGHKSFISWPIYTADDKLLGSIQLGSYNQKAILEIDKQFFKMIAELFAAALERKIADEQLKEIEKRRRLLENAIENSQEVVIQGNDKGIIFYVNSSVEEIFGYKPEELIGESISILAAPGGEELQKTMLEEAKEKGKVTFESVRKHKNGTLIPVLMNVNVLKDDTSDSITLNAIIVDITDLKQLEESLRNRSYELEVLNKIISAGYFATNTSELIDFTLNTILQSLDYSGGAMYLVNEETEVAKLNRSLGMSNKFTEQANELPTKGRTFKKLFIDGKSIFATEFLSHSNGHHEFGISTLLAIPFLSKQKVIGALFLSTKEKRDIPKEELALLETIGREIGIALSKIIAEEELIESEKSFQIIFDSIANFFIVFSIESGEIMKVNKKVQEKTGYSIIELLDVNFYDLLQRPSKKQMIEKLQKLPLNKKHDCSITIKTKNDSSLKLELDCYKVELAGKKTIIAIQK